jgi:hypothetical protein
MNGGTMFALGNVTLAELSNARDSTLESGSSKIVSKAAFVLPHDDGMTDSRETQKYSPASRIFMTLRRL